MSGRFTPAAATLISTSFLAGCGTGRTIGFNTSADPGTSKPMAVICSGMAFLCGIKACLPFDRSPLRPNDTALLTDAGGGSTFGLWPWMKICHVELMIDRKEHTSELQSLMRIPYTVLFLKKKK